MGDVLPGQLALFTPETMHGDVGQRKLDQFRNMKQNCTDCKLCANRTSVVFGSGQADYPTIAAVYGSPEALDDVVGEPMQNERIAQQFRRVLSFLGVEEKNTFVTPVVGCKALSRQLTAAEAKACAPLLLGQLRAVRPKMIICFGVMPTLSVLNVYKKNAKQVVAMFGEMQLFDEVIPVMPTYGLEALLGRSSKAVEIAMDEHLKRVRRRLHL